MVKIVIAGYGYVGQAMAAALDSNRSVQYYVDDPGKGRYIPPNTYPDGVIVAVSTPMAPDGRCDVTNVADVFNKYGGTKYLVKSAVPPTFLKNFENSNRITCSPEFLRGSTSHDPVQEFLDSEFAIYGGGAMRWWHELLKPGLPKLKNIRFCSLEQAAFAKYLENSFLATKVCFFNEMYSIYTALGYKDFDTMVEVISNDPRIGFSHTQVPGPDGRFGYGGHCLPKDVSAMIHMARVAGEPADLLTTVRWVNKAHRGEDD